MGKEKKAKPIVYKKNPTSSASSSSSSNASSNSANNKPIVEEKQEMEVEVIPKSSNKMNFHEKVSFRGRKNMVPIPIVAAAAATATAAAADIKPSSSSSSSSSSRGNCDVKWETNCEALVAFCQEHQKLPTAAKGMFVTSDDQKLNLGTWMDKQKVRYKSMNPKNALSEMELSKLMAIKEFRDWAEDPLTDPDVRWDTHCQALADYCQEHEKLPTAKYVTTDDRKLNLGIWMNRQKVRLKGQVERPPLDETQMNKLKAIKEFRVWLEDPLSNSVVRWDAHYQAFSAYCQEHNEMPPWKYVTPNEPKLNLEAWVDNQKKRYKGKGTGAALNDNELSKLMEVKEFREWTEKVAKQQSMSGKKENNNNTKLPAGAGAAAVAVVTTAGAADASGNDTNTANSSSSSSSSSSTSLSGLALLSASGDDGLSGLAMLSAGVGGGSNGGEDGGKKKDKKQKHSHSLV